MNLAVVIESSERQDTDDSSNDDESGRLLNILCC